MSKQNKMSRKHRIAEEMSASRKERRGPLSRAAFRQQKREARRLLEAIRAR